MWLTLDVTAAAKIYTLCIIFSKAYTEITAALKTPRVPPKILHLSFLGISLLGSHHLRLLTFSGDGLVEETGDTRAWRGSCIRCGKRLGLVIRHSAGRTASESYMHESFVNI